MPAALCALVAGILTAISVVLGLPILVMIAMTGGGFDMIIVGVPTVFFVVMGWLTFRSLRRGNMIGTFLLGLIPTLACLALWLRFK